MLITNKTAADLSSMLKENSLMMFTIYADWCGACEMLKPELEKVSEQGFTVVRTAVEEEANQKFVLENKVAGTPQMFIYKDSKIVWTFNGYLPAEVILEELNKWKQ